LLAFIWHEASKGDPGSVIDGDMDVLPAGASNQIAAVTCDTVTGALDPGEFLDIEVDELAWVLALVTADRRRWLEQGQTVETMAAQEPRDGGFGEAGLPRNLEAGQTQSAQGQDDGDLSWRRLPGAALRSRGAITQTRHAFTAGACHPLAHRALGETALLGGHLRRESMLEDRLNDSLSTVRRQSGMLMELHVWVGFEGLNVCTPISLSNPSPHEQPIETSHLALITLILKTQMERDLRPSAICRTFLTSEYSD